MTEVNEEQHISAKYATELIELKCNSKPLINSLTMMAEDYIRHAPIIVQTIENHLRRVKPELKLAVLYLIDSIVKNVKKEYVQLFTHNIISTFTQTFEQVSEKTRTQMWKLRQTWNDVFSTHKLYSIDFKCHQTDPGWPVMAAPPSTASIHVNPKFLAKSLTIVPPTPTTQTAQSVAASTISSSLSTATSSPSLSSLTTVVEGTATGLSDLASGLITFLQDPPGDITEAQMREQLLIKQKELLELQTRKLELELLHTKAQLEEKTRKQIELHTQQQMETKQTMQHVRTILRNSLSPPKILSPVRDMVPARSVSPLPISSTDPRKRKVDRESSDSPSNMSSPLPISSTDPRKRKVDRESSDSQSKMSSPLPISSTDPRKRKVDRERSESQSKMSSPLPISSTDPRKRKVDRERSESQSKMSRDAHPILKERDDGSRNGSSQQGRKSSSSSTSTSPVVGGALPSTTVTADVTGVTLDESPSKRRKKSVDTKGSSSSSQRDKESKEKDVKDGHSSKDKDKRSKGKSSSSSSSSSSSRRRRDSENSGSIVGSVKSSTKELKEKESRERKRTREDAKFRRTAVLQRNYRRRTEVSNIEDDTELISKKDKENHSHGGKGKSDYKKDSSKSGGVGDGLVGSLKGVMNDIDLRFDGLKDVDLRNDASGAGSAASTVDQPPMKKPRNAGNANLIADLFGREDVDLRQPSGSSSWSQLKTRTPSISDGGSGSEIMKEDRRASQNKSLSQQQQDEDIRDILINRPRPPPTISPAESVDSVRTNASCDPLGRPLLYNRLPDDPAARKQSLNAVDPVERFRSQFLERPSGGDLTDLDLTKAARQAQQEFGMGYFTKEQYAVIMRQLMQIHEVSKIRDVQQIQQRGPGPNPWTEADANGTWNQFGGPRGPTDFGQTRFPGMQGNAWNQHMPGLPWGQPHAPRGPNPFEEAAAAAAGPLKMNDDLLPPVNMMELDNVRKDTSGTIPIDKVLRQVRFYGDTAIVLQGMLGDEPREISFRKSEARNVFIDQEREPIRCVIGKPVLIYLDRKKHMLKLGAPTRELYIDGDHYEACFDGPPLRVRVDRYLHSFKIEGPPPQVEVGTTLRYDLLAGRVNLFVDGNSVTIYLDEKPQLIDVCGFPVILRFCDEFHTVLLNGRPFPVNFGGLPMPVTVPQGRKHYLRFSGLSDNTRRAMLQYIRIRDSKGGPPSMRDDGSLAPVDISPFGGPFRGRGGAGIRGRGGPPMMMVRGRAPMFNPPMLPPMGNILPPGADFPINDAFHPGILPQFESNPNPLDVLANIMPPSVELGSAGDRFRTRSTDNAYESDSPMLEERVEIKAEKPVTNNELAPVIGSPLDVQDLLSRLMMAGLLPTAVDEKKPAATTGEEDKDKAPVDTEATKEEVTTKDEVKIEVTQEEEAEGEKKVEPATIPPIEVVDVTFDKLKDRREKLIDQVCSGVQCGSCGLRFFSDQTVRYSQHLDWHFRQNRREKANVRKAQSRKWYYDLSDWIQFAEIEDLEERAQSLFESQDADMDGDERSPGTVLNPDLYTVLSAEHEGAVCPQCNEGFESFFDEEKEEWRLRDAFLAENVEEGIMKLYHPICHQDYTTCLQGKSMLTKAEETPSEEPAPPVKPPDDEDEVLILKEGKPEVEVMDIAIEDDDNKDTLKESTSLDSSTTLVVPPPTEIHLIDDEPNDSIIEKDSDKQNETICINDDDDDENGVDVSINNKKETTTTDSQQKNVDSSSISHNNNNSNSTNIQIDNASIITLSVSGDDDALSKDNLNDNTVDTSIELSSSTNTINNSSNISVSVLSSIGSGGKGDAPGSPALVMIDDDTSDGGLFASIPGISDKSVFNIALSSGTGEGVSLGQKEAPYKPIIYESMKFDVPTPLIKTEPVEPDEDLQNEDILSLDDIIKANMTDDAQDGMESRGQSGSAPAEVVVPDAPTAVDIDLTGEDDDVSNDESNLVAGSAALDGNFLLETAAAVSVVPKAVVVSIDAASLKPRNTEAKPRLGGRKLVNCPPKVSGKEVSGLCTIC